jgi:RNA polymerase sigma-70 factor (ECF subfamily)
MMGGEYFRGSAGGVSDARAAASIVRAAAVLEYFREPLYISGNLSGFAASNPDISDIGESESIMRQAQRPQQATQIASAGTGDAELVRRALARDEAAIRAIMQANNRRLYRFARGILRNDSEAEDVVQETYVRAFTHLESFRGDSSLATWLTRIAMNEALGRLRRQRPGQEWSSVPQATLEAQIIPFPLASADDPEKSMAQREIQRVVERAIDELPEAFRLVFITRVIEGMNVEETAEILGLKPETVKTRLHRARTMLRDNVENKIGPVVMEAFPFAGKRCERLTETVLKRLGFSGTSA